MLKTNKAQFLFLLSILITFFSCQNVLQKSSDIEIINKVYSELSPKDSVYTTIHIIDSKENQFLKGNSGAYIFIPANAINNPNDRRVAIIIKEYFSNSSMINSNLSTTSNGKLLETGGMINLIAKADGENLKLKDNEHITVLFPKLNKNKFQLFYGELNSIKNINWTPALIDKTKFEKDSSKIVKEQNLVTYRMAGFVNAFVNPTLKDGSDYLGLRSFDLKLKDNSIAIDKFEEILDSTYSPEECKQIHEFYKGSDYSSIFQGFRCDVTIDGICSNFSDYNEYNAGEYILNDTIKTIMNKLYTAVKKMPPFDFSQYNLTKDREIYANFQIAGIREFDQERFLRSMYFKNSDEINIKVSRYNVFNSLKLGWLNCDRFYETKSPKINFKVATKEIDVEVYLKFENFNGIMKGRKEGKYFYFENVPIGEKVKIIGLSYIDNKLRLAILDSLISEKIVTLKGFKPFRLEELDKELNK